MANHRLLKTIMFAGPSGIGKTYIANVLMEQYPDYFEQPKLYTTRKPRSNEKSHDRLHITTQRFEEMLQQKEFIVHANFGGNMYGFTETMIYPKNKHLLINIWPWLVPDFSKYEHTTLVGLQAPPVWRHMLVTRLRERGDTEGIIQTRIELIEKDIQDLDTNKTLVDKHGKFFMVSDDRTVPDEVVPWLIKELGLQS